MRATFAILRARLRDCWKDDALVDKRQRFPSSEIRLGGVLIRFHAREHWQTERERERERERRGLSRRSLLDCRARSAIDRIGTVA